MAPSVQPMIVTADLERALRFYVGVLDAEEAQRFPDDGPTFFVGLRVGGSELGLVADADAAPGAEGRILISADVPDVDAALARVDTHGGHVLGPPNDMPWGQRVAHVRDPDGNTVNLTQTL